MSSECPFCSIDPQRVFYEGELTRGIWDGFPVSTGHALVITRRHVPSWFEATPQERIEIVGTIDSVRAIVEQQHHPSGFNIGINVGSAAGQTIFHLHAHVIPRYEGDVPDPRGGVRHVIPAKANYIAGKTESKRREHKRSIVTGDEEDPLLPHLLTNFTDAIRLDIGVAFTQFSGVELLLPYLRDLVRKPGGQLRFLTGDYLGITDPDALMRILDLEGNNIQRRVFETASTNRSFHPKTYIFRYDDEHGIAFVGSSNLSEMALRGGIEWDYKLVSTRDPQSFLDVVQAFEALFKHPCTTELTYDWIHEYRGRRQKLEFALPVEAEAPSETVPPPPPPHEIQIEALNALEATRRAGNKAGLVVMATGLGKTLLAAFDCNRTEFQRVLFVAHREEILSQAMEQFRRIRPDASFGHYTGEQKNLSDDIIFASIQTLGKRNHLQQFAPNRFDYVVVDEFHHGSAPSYRRLIDYFHPQFLLGLTATPERSDGGDLLALCEENLVYRCDFAEGIKRGLLCPFHYFGVPDEVDYRNIPWRSSRFDEEKLTEAVATQARAENALGQHRNRAGERTIAFCVSQRHADFMADYFRNAGRRAVAVHSGESSAPRAASLDSLRDGTLDVIFAVDMFNEGVDVPTLDTVMMLRPTESKIVWMQQFGRGLRISGGKTHLTVIDYIGNHRTFLLKPLTLFEALFPIKPKDIEIWNALQRIQDKDVDLPPGCEVTYELESIDIFKGLLKLRSKPGDELREYYEDFKERNGQRPTAIEAFHDGFSPRFARTSHGSWLRFVQAMGDLTEGQQSVLAELGEFLDAIEETPMVRSYKMLVLKAMLRLDRIPGQISLSDLAIEFGNVASTSSRLSSDLSTSPDNKKGIEALLKKDPIAAWVGAKGTKGRAYFKFDDDIFTTDFSTANAQRELLQELMREIVDWRIAEYLAGKREEIQPSEPNGSKPKSAELQLWHPSQRAEIPPLFGLRFSPGNWNAGFVRAKNHIFLLVTLGKETKAANFQYKDHFISANQFQWQSQNQTAQSSKTGREIREHSSLGITVHLFVRKNSKTPNGTGAPFYYCGEAEFATWHGEKPITVEWRLKVSVPERLWELLNVPRSVQKKNP